MIKLECLQATDSNAVGFYEFGQNIIYLGRKNTDIILQDYSWPENAMFFEVVDDHFYVHPQKDLEFYLVNGKRCTGVKKVKKNEIITIGSAKFKIIDFHKSHFLTKKEILDEKLNTIIESHSPKIDIIRKLTEVMNQKR